MHFDQRTQFALQEIGLSMDEIKEASNSVVALTEATASEIERFFADQGTVYSDMDQAHSASDIQEHSVDHVDLYTHAADLRGYLRFDSWGIPIEGGRVLSETESSEPEMVELTLGPTVNDRVRFATDPERL